MSSSTNGAGTTSAVSSIVTEEHIAKGLATIYGGLPTPAYFDLTVAEAIYVQLYQDTNETTGKQTSRKERTSHGFIDTGLVYGEVEFGPFAEILIGVRKYGVLLPHNDQSPLPKFVDIGCGIGKAVFTAALVHEWRECHGIEILKGLYDICEDIQGKWVKEIHDQLPEERQGTEIVFSRGDATALSWADADVAFANSTCFPPELMSLLASKANLMKDGSIFITTTKELPSEKYFLLEAATIFQSFGNGQVFIQMKGKAQTANAVAKANAAIDKVQYST